jgi:hypothetical protein
LKYFYQWKNYDLATNLGVVFLEIFIFSFSILMACDVILEMIRQIENDEPSLIVAIGKTIIKDMVKILPLATVWAIIWFILSIIEVLLSKKRGDDNDLNAYNVAETLSGYGNISISTAFIEAINKGVRMVLFLILPAVAWENLGFGVAVKKGFAILKAHLGDFANGYALTYLTAVIVFLPAAIIFELGTGRHGNPPLIHFPEYVWVGVIIYMGFAWSFCIYMEQMFMAQLYLWHLKWEEEIEYAKKNKQPLPSFHQIPQPILLAQTPDLFE